MTSPFDVRALIGRTFGDVLDEIAPGWRLWGFLDGGRAALPIGSTGGPPPSEEEIREEAEIKRKSALIIEALCEGTIELADIDGSAVPRWVWASRRWWFHCNGKRECLEARTVAGQKIEFYTRIFREAAAEGSNKKSNRPRVRRVTFKKTLNDLLKDEETKKELDRLPDDAARSEFLAAKVGCGISMALKVLQGKV